MKTLRISIFFIWAMLFSVGAVYAQDVIITGITTTPVTCGDGSDGTITVTVTGGNGQYSYLLVRGAVAVESAGPMVSNTYTFTGHGKYANYIIIVSDQDNSTSDGFSFATIGGADPLSLNPATVTDISCNGVNDGRIQISATGEGGNYIFELAGPENRNNGTGDFSGLQGGDYTVTVRDADGCPSTDISPVLTINDPPAVTVSVDNVAMVDCYGEPTGSISISPGGGIPGGGTGYTFAWTGPNGYTSSAQDISNLEAGDYFVTVFDSNLCPVSTGPITISQASQITVTLDASTDVYCFGGNNGSASITPGGGTGAYSFSWNGQDKGFVSTAEDPNDLIADTYDLTISDASSCSRTFIDFVSIEEPDELLVTVDVFTNVSCPGGSNASAEITPSGGTAPFTFSWTGATTSYVSGDQNPRDMPADVFDLSIGDANGCIHVFPAILTITEPLPISLVLNSFNDASCFGTGDGSASVTLNGGTPIYTITWTGTGTGFTSSGNAPNDLVADVYDVSVADANGCTENFPALVTILEPADLLVTVDLLTPVNCNGAATGAIEINTSGGTPLYNYSWTGPNGFTADTEDISNLEAGDYNLSLTDANGCTKDYPGLATVATNTAISGSFTLTDISCAGLDDGAIQPKISGGTPNYTYSWVGPSGFTSDKKNLDNLAPGDYLLTVTDALGCSQPMPAQTVAEPAAITATVDPVNIDCFGAANGSIDLSPAGGLAPYLFAWTGPGGFTANAEDISLLEAGTYNVTITDANGCIMPFPGIATITEPAEITLVPLVTPITCSGYKDGSIRINVSGGTPDYSYSWTGPGGFSSNDKDISGLEAGTYDLVITDNNGCVANFPAIATFVNPPPITASLSSQTNILCYGEATGAINIDAGGGVGLLLFKWTNGAGITVSTDEDPIDLPAGVYSLSITDENTCTMVYPDMATLTEPLAFTTTLTVNNITCSGDADGSISVSSTGGTGSHEYSINGNLDPEYQPGNSFFDLTQGFYTIWTRDANLCVISDTVTIIEPEKLQIAEEVLGGQNLCAGDALESISINGVSGGVTPYQYSINGGTDFSASNLFEKLAAGDYQTVVRDANGCEIFGNMNTLTEPEALYISSYTQSDVSTCYDAAEGSISVSAGGGTGTKTYSLNGSNSNTTGAFLNLTGGSYTLNISDANACTLDTAIVILAPPTIVVDNLTLTDVSACAGDSNGAIDISGSGGTGTITYALNGGPYQPTGLFSGLVAGPHTITLKDDNDCTRDTIVTLSEPAPVVSNIVKTDATFGNLGSIEFTATVGGQSPYEFSIEGPGGSFSTETLYTDLAVGTYHAVARDALGCTYEEMIPILDVLPLEVVVNINNISCFGEMDGSIEMLPQDAEGAVEYSIDSGLNFVSTGLFEGLGPASYKLVAIDAAGKLFTGTAVILEPAELILSSTVTPAECNAFSETGAIDLTVSGGTPVYTYLWSDGSTEGDRNGIAAGTYTLSTSDANNCSRMDIITVSSFVNVDAFAGNDTTICYGSSIQLNGDGGHTASWSPTTFLSDPDIANPMAIEVTENISYVLTISEEESIFGCFNTDTVSIFVDPLIGLAVTPDTFIIKGTSIQLEAIGEGFSSYHWEPEDGLDNSTIPNPIAAPQQTMRYSVYALNENGCEENASMTLEIIEDIMAYNVFSPNGDGINEYFDIKNADRFPEIVVEVYSRWGDLLFQSKGYDDSKRWDGRTRGKDAPLGTYYYVLIPYSGAKPITGNVTIIR